MTRIKWVERYIQEQYEDQGYDVIHNGAPDLILLKDGDIEFVEVKMSNNKVLNRDQRRALRLLKEHGFNARVEIVPKLTIPKKYIYEPEQLKIISQYNRGKLDPRDIYHLIVRSQNWPTLKNFTRLLISLFNERNTELDRLEASE